MADVLVDSQASASTSEDWRNAAGREKEGGDFVASQTYTVTKVDISIQRVSTVTGNINLELWSDSSGAPGSILANGLSDTTLNASTLTASQAFYSFTYATGPSLTASTAYWIVLSSTVAISGTNFLSTGMNTGAGSRREIADDNMATPFTQDRTSIIGIAFKTYKTAVGGGFGALSALMELA